MPEEVCHAQLRCVRLGKALERVATHVECGIVTLGVGPNATGLRETRESFCDRYDYRVAASPPRKRNDVVAVAPVDLDRLVFAAGTHLSKLAPQFQEMPGPGQLHMSIAPVAREAVPIRRLH